MRIRFIQAILDKIRIELDSLHPAPFKVFYIGGKNAGDIFNAPLLKYFNIRYCKTRLSNANLLCVGSILGSFVYPQNTKKPKHKSQKCIIAGAGFLETPHFEEKFSKDVTVLALRGKLSKERLENMTNSKFECTLADPGLLVSKVYPQNRDKKFKAGIIPHVMDKAIWDKNKIRLNKSDYTVIDIEQDVKGLVEKICECEVILSSSLHGLIFSDSYNIPNRQLIISDKLIGGNYKFTDYYSSFDMELPESIDLRKTNIDETLLYEITRSYTDKSEMIKQKQQDLINIYSDLDKYLRE